jgi:hypothetical protein
MSSPSLPSLTVSALLVPLPFSSWVIRHSEMDAATPPTMVNLPLQEDHRPYLSPPSHDTLTEPVSLPAEEPDTYTDEFSFRAAWELTRSLESLPAPWRHTYRKWNRVLAEDHDLSMSNGGAHRFTTPQPPTVPPRPPTPTTLDHAFSRAHAMSRTGDMRARLYRRLGIVRCARTSRLARDPDSSWTSHGGLDRRILWAQT